MLKNIRKNPLLLTDCYNLSHFRLKCDQTWEISHMYNRAKGMILYGFNEVVTTLLNTKIEKWMIDEAEQHAKRLNLLFPRELWQRVIDECDGNIPLKVQAVPEGTYCPTGTPFAQISNTVKGFGELVTYFEGIFMMAYFPSSCATEALKMRRYLENLKNERGYHEGFMWRFHSFGFRGHKSLEDAYWAGTAWSMFLQGTDDFHIAGHIKDLSMGSISALAHKVTQQYDNEYDCFVHSIDVTAEDGLGIVALVIDTYDAWNVIDNHIVPLARYANEKGVHLVFRPDSGDIFEQAVAIYEKSKCYDLDNISVIIGEGMSFENAKHFDKKFDEAGVPLTFINYGIGAGFYKHIERDTLGWAMKTAFSNGKPRMKVVKSNPFKQSIPNAVHLKYNEDNQMVVHNGISYKGNEGLYYIVYIYTPSKDKPYSVTITYDDYKSVSERALSKDTSQERIVLSDETKALIQKFHNKYK